MLIRIWLSGKNDVTFAKSAHTCFLQLRLWHRAPMGNNSITQETKKMYISSEYPDGMSVDFYGYEVMGYYIQRICTFFSVYAVHIRLLYILITLCILTMLVLFVMFMRQIRLKNRMDAYLDAVRTDLLAGFKQVLTAEHSLTVEMLEMACNMTLDRIREVYDTRAVGWVIAEISMDMSRKLDNIPNLEPLCAMLGVRALYEKELFNKNRVFFTLQYLVNMHLRASAGLLALYIHHHNNKIRYLARMCYIISTEEDSFKYLMEDLNEPMNLWRPMTLHRLFAWLRANNKQMPQFLVYARVLKNEESAAFMINEVAYWGNEKEKAKLNEFFLSPKLLCRKAALNAVSLLRDEKQEQMAVDLYDQQPESIRQEILRVVCAINSGRHTQFLVRAFRTATSKTTREIALTSLYAYGEEGRSTFEMLRHDLNENEKDRKLMAQIDAVGILNQMRTL